MNPKTKEQIEQIKSIYPEDVADALCRLASEIADEQTKHDCEEALYQLKAIAENPYNSDYYRVFYIVLGEIAKR